MKNNKAVYEQSNFEFWSCGPGLLPAERLLINIFLDPHLKTLEVGTGTGRILFGMRSLGFTSLTGYDFIPRYIEKAREYDKDGAIQFDIADATRLRDADESFDQILYLQQMICSIEEAEDREKTVKNAYRVLKQNGTALFSFLCLRARAIRPFYGLFLRYIRFLRWIKGVDRPDGYQPWLRHGRSINWCALLDKPPYVYWYGEREAWALLESAGFKIHCIASEWGKRQGLIMHDIERIERNPIQGILYFVCKK